MIYRTHCIAIHTGQLNHAIVAFSHSVWLIGCDIHLLLGTLKTTDIYNSAIIEPTGQISLTQSCMYILLPIMVQNLCLHIAS